MRRRDLNQLTDREREVLELLRRDFTNEQIAERFGISLDGAKYHVSQILSKLGVATREEAAALALGERRRWWAAWPLWAKIAGATTLVAAALSGLALLAWGVVRTQSDEDANSLSLASELSGRIVYLAPADQSQWIATQALLDAAGILVTQDVDQFRSQAGSVQAEALIVDKEYAGQLESAWLQQNLDGGKVLVGARINISELGQLLGVSGCESSPGFGNYPESRLFYSRCSRRICGNGESGGVGQDYLDRNPVGQFRLLIKGIANSAAASCGGVGAAQAATPTR